MVAGLSSRFGGKIKQFARVGPEGEALLEYSIKQALPAGFNKIILIVGDKTEKPMKDFFGDSFMGVKVQYALQEYNSKDRDRPWGTADALCSAKQAIDCPFVVCNGDDLYGESAFKILTKHLSNHKEEATLGYRLIDVLPDQGSTNRGIFTIENGFVSEINEIIGIVKSNLSASCVRENYLCSMNIFALHPHSIGLLDIAVKKFKEEHKGDRKIECYLPVELSNLIKSRNIMMRVYNAKDKWIGITNPDDEALVMKKLAK